MNNVSTFTCIMDALSQGITKRKAYILYINRLTQASQFPDNDNTAWENLRCITIKFLARLETAYSTNSHI